MTGPSAGPFLDRRRCDRPAALDAPLGDPDRKRRRASAREGAGSRRARSPSLVHGKAHRLRRRTFGGDAVTAGESRGLAEHDPMVGRSGDGRPATARIGRPTVAAGGRCAVDPRDRQRRPRFGLLCSRRDRRRCGCRHSCGRRRRGRRGNGRGRRRSRRLGNGHRGGRRCRRRLRGGRRRWWRRWRRRSRRKERQGVDIGLPVAHADAEVHVGHVVLVLARRPGVCDGLALRDEIALPHEQRAEVRQRRLVTARGDDRDRRPVGRHLTGEGDLAGGGRADHRRAIEGDVDAAVLSSRVRIVADDEAS
jgi:hypothetical protein